MRHLRGGWAKKKHVSNWRQANSGKKVVIEKFRLRTHILLEAVVTQICLKSCKFLGEERIKESSWCNAFLSKYCVIFGLLEHIY